MKKIFVFSVILFLSMCFRVSAAPGDKYVIRVPGDCKTIREACDKSFPGDTIYIGAGEYTAKDGFVLKSNVKLVGQGRRQDPYQAGAYRVIRDLVARERE